MSRSVTAPDGRSWTVRRRWAPRLGSDTLWRRFRRRFRQTFRRGRDVADVADVPGGCLPDLGEGFAIAIVVVVVVLLAIFVGFPILVALLDVLLVIVLTIVGIVGRVLFRRPWVIEAREGDHTPLTWNVKGWRASSRRLEEIERSLSHGIVPPADGPTGTASAQPADG